MEPYTDTETWRPETVQVVVPAERLVVIIGWAERNETTKEIDVGYVIRPVMAVEVLLEHGYAIDKPLKATRRYCRMHGEFARDGWAYQGHRVRRRPLFADDSGYIASQDDVEADGPMVRICRCYACAWEAHVDDECLTGPIQSIMADAQARFESWEENQQDATDG